MGCEIANNSLFLTIFFHLASRGDEKLPSLVTFNVIEDVKLIVPHKEIIMKEWG